MEIRRSGIYHSPSSGKGYEGFYEILQGAMWVRISDEAGKKIDEALRDEPKYERNGD